MSNSKYIINQIQILKSYLPELESQLIENPDYNVQLDYEQLIDRIEMLEDLI